MHIPVQINVSFGLLITVRARAIKLITGTPCLAPQPLTDCPTPAVASLIYSALYVIYI